MKYFDYDLKLLGKICQKLYKENIYFVLKERRVYNYLDKYMVANKDTEFSVEKIDKTVSNDVVWVCWLQGIEKAPDIVKACIASIKRHLSNRVIIITASNYAEFVNLPDYINRKWKDGRISHTHFSDILRVSLLSLYGGCWIDSTVFLMGNVPNFMTLNSLFCFNIPRYGRQFKLGCSWWIAAEERQPIIVEIRSVLFEYWKHENKLIDYFLFHKIFKKIIERKKEYQVIWHNKPYFEVGHTHVLLKFLNEQFDLNKLNEIKSLSSVQKLTYKRKFSDQCDTFYNQYITAKTE